MKVIIAGSRDLDVNELPECHNFLYSTWNYLVAISEGDIEAVTGCCPSGPDQVPLEWEKERLNTTKVNKFPADWDKFGRAAGPIRNKQMAEFADVLIAIMVPGSRGTTDMIKQMLKLGKPVFVYTHVSS